MTAGAWRAFPIEGSMRDSYTQVVVSLQIPMMADRCGCLSGAATRPRPSRDTIAAMESAQIRRLPRWPFPLDSDKAVEAALFVVHRVTDPTLHSVSKVLYHADKAHLARYGRPISGDRYVAMKHGPVPSATYDMFKTLRGDSNFPLSERARSAMAVEDYTVRALRAADESVLSTSEMECLAASAAEHGNKSFYQRTADSHGPAWQAAGENDLIALECLLLEIDNSDELRAHLAQDD